MGIHNLNTFEFPFSSLRIFPYERRMRTNRSTGKIFLLLCIFSALQTTGLSLHRDSPIASSGTASPYLEPIKYNTTVFMGQNVYLPCVVKHLGDKTVSWIRKKDLHILSSGTQVYTNDKRFTLLREGKLLNAWTLKISAVKKKDEGSYECQVNTEPKMTATLHLIVLGSPEDETSGALALGMLDSPYHQRDDHRSKGYEAKILGGTLMELEQGQLANFTCIISHGGPLLPTPSPIWFLNEIPIQKTRGGFNVDTEKTSFNTISQLVIVKVDKHDGGKYTCGGEGVYPASIVLRILPYHSLNARWKEVSIASSSVSHHTLSWRKSLWISKSATTNFALLLMIQSLWFLSVVYIPISMIMFTLFSSILPVVLI